jgi:hypothetical protein
MVSNVALVRDQGDASVPNGPQDLADVIKVLIKGLRVNHDVIDIH